MDLVDNEPLYTIEVHRLMYEAKNRLPDDFPLTTEVVRDGPAAFIRIEILNKHFAWRTVEDRLDIAITLENLKQLIQKTGISCVIDKPK